MLVVQGRYCILSVKIGYCLVLQVWCVLCVMIDVGFDLVDVIGVELEYFLMVLFVVVIGFGVVEVVDWVVVV